VQWCSGSGSAETQQPLSAVAMSGVLHQQPTEYNSTAGLSVSCRIVFITAAARVISNISNNSRHGDGVNLALSDVDNDRRCQFSSCQLQVAARQVVLISLLSSPYVIGQTIFNLGFLLLSSFFPRLISAVGDRMSTILPHMVWP